MMKRRKTQTPPAVYVVEELFSDGTWRPCLNPVYAGRTRQEAKARWPYAVWGRTVRTAKYVRVGITSAAVTR